MDDRIVDFVRGLRAAGVRVSMAESVDAMRAVSVLGVTDKVLFRESLRATLVKESDDFAVFNELFPLYFGSGGPPLQNAMEELSPEDQEMLKAALSALGGRLQQLLDWLTSGDGPTREELEELARRAGVQWANNPGEARWVTRRMLRQMGFEHLEELIQKLAQQLQQMGMSQDAIQKLMGVIEANREALAEHVAQQVGLQIAQERADQARDLHGSDLMHKPFQSLTESEADVLRKEVQRLVAQLRSRAALRRKRGKEGKFDPKSTIRANQRYGGVPFEMKFKRKKLKPNLVLICDVSTSMRPVAEFMLRLIYELQDQVAKARSFAFNADMEEISVTLSGNRAGDAVAQVLYQIPPGYYATDLGNSLATFFKEWLDSVTGRTTVIILGDGRNNYNSPRIDLMKDLERRSKRLIWFNPEHRRQWGSGDSDMLEYAPLCNAVYQVRNLAQLSAAIDEMLAGD
ncbi:MAG: VWA domain-containing protein [Chloroflexi bacterium]|nr:VWA domain-containing protein [Chloroflexota bacterium]MCI0575898.1 VWA domain-containing protein [Chloroflexota bacterium]MCI0648307.1 VWA domain-containing protein [Chloroflexota bacterium]MCI0727712.1 VWA domain-containing protein [Chloroflexota bacterium]